MKNTKKAAEQDSEKERQMAKKKTNARSMAERVVDTMLDHIITDIRKLPIVTVKLIAFLIGVSLLLSLYPGLPFVPYVEENPRESKITPLSPNQKLDQPDILFKGELIYGPYH